MNRYNVSFLLLMVVFALLNFGCGGGAPATVMNLIEGRASATLAVSRGALPTDTVIVGGELNAKAFTAVLSANHVSEVHVTAIRFLATSGNTYPVAQVTNMRVYLNGANVSVGVVDLTSGLVTTDFHIPASGDATVTLVVDTSLVTTPSSLQIAIVAVTALDRDSHQATVLAENGEALSATNALNSESYTVADSGMFTLTGVSGVPSEGILVGDGATAWYPVATYRALARFSGMAMSDLFLRNASVGSVYATTTTADPRVATLGIFDSNGVLKCVTTLSGGKAHFALGNAVNQAGLGALEAPRDTSRQFTVKSKLNTVGDGNASGALLRLVVDETKGTGNSGVIVEDMSTGADITASHIIAARSIDGSLRVTATAGDVFAIRRTKVSVVSVAQTGSSESELSDFTQKPVFRFAVVADPNGDATWKGIKFTVSGSLGSESLSRTISGVYGSSGPTGTLGFTTVGGSGGKYVRSFRLYETASNQEVQAGSYTVHVAWNEVRGEGEVAVILNDSIEEVVAAGGSKVYELRADVGGVSAGNNALNVRIRGEANDRREPSDFVTADPDGVDGTADGEVSMVYGRSSRPYSILWSDGSGSPHSATNRNTNAIERDWTNDRLIRIDGIGWSRSKSF